jgi:hypothetical protein
MPISRIFFNDSPAGDPNRGGTAAITLSIVKRAFSSAASVIARSQGSLYNVLESTNKRMFLNPAMNFFAPSPTNKTALKINTAIRLYLLRSGATYKIYRIAQT